ncbi:MAG TPA: Ldh family oxidoreductase, partial [Caulobacter sp.]|nr:Ldh family oxidoreductase [Caulobacter sp.]
MSLEAGGERADAVRLSLDEVRTLARRVLTATGLPAAHVDAVAETMVAGERDGCASHGVYRLLVAANSIAKGVVSVDAEPLLDEPAPALVRVNGG